VNIRAVYGTPCSSQYFCKRSNVSGTVDVRVRHVTTLGTNEAVFIPLPQFVAYRARLTRICRIHIIHSYSNALRLVSHKVLQLSPRPSVQPCTYSFPGFNPVTNVCQIFQTNFRSATRDGFGNNCFGDNMIYVRDMMTFVARDFAETLFCALRTVGLETPTMGEIFIPIMPQFTTIKHATARSGRDVVLTHITTHNTIPRSWGGIRYIQDQVKKPLAFLANQFGFGCPSLIHQISLVGSDNKRNLGAPIQCESRQNAIFNAVGSLVKVDGLGTKHNLWNRFIFENAFIGIQRLIGAAHFVYSIAGHLTTEFWTLGTNGIIGKVVQSYPVPAAVLLSKWHNIIASGRKGASQISKSIGLFFGMEQLDGDSAFHIGYILINHDSIVNHKEMREQALSLPGLNPGVSRATG